MTPERLPERLMVALDVPSQQEAQTLIATLSPLGITFKIGMQLFYEAGPSLVTQIQEKGSRVFVDLKLHDIPNTVARASETLVRQGITFFNIHTQGGPAMMRSAVESAKQAARSQGLPDPSVIGVTLLTSLSADDLQQSLHVPDEPLDYVVHLAGLAKNSGLHGVVCSAREAAAIRKACGKDFLLITPGIRPADSPKDDQSRTLTPAEALEAGADYLVVGRPITRADNPKAAAQRIIADMSAVAV